MILLPSQHMINRFDMALLSLLSLRLAAWLAADQGRDLQPGQPRQPPISCTASSVSSEPASTGPAETVTASAATAHERCNRHHAAERVIRHREAART